MKNRWTPPPEGTLLRRRGVLALGLSALGGCGGGSGALSIASPGGITDTVSLPGTGGTGISVQGTISGFGSVIINGTKYDDSSASLTLDGSSITSSALRIGMVATVRGSKSGTSTGTASSIDVWSIARGPITQWDGSGNLVVAGMTLHTGTGTSYEGVANYAGLATAQAAGSTVTVWGIQASADGVQWSASRITVAAAPDTVIASTGRVHVSGGVATLNGWTLSGSGVNALTDQSLVRVQGQVGSTATTLVVSSIRLLESTVPQNQAEAEVEGLVTSYTSNSSFTVGAYTVNAANAQINLNGYSLGLGCYLSISGSVVNGVLVAKELEVKGSSSTPSTTTLDITGTIQEFDRVSEFEVRGQQCDATHAVVSGGSLSDLAVGKKVRVVGTPQGEESLLVAYLYFL